MRLKRSFVAAGFFLILACGSQSKSNVVLIPVGPTPVALGQTLQFISTDGGVIWIVLGPEESGSIDPFGLYTAPDEMPPDPNIVIMGQVDGTENFAFVQLVN